MSNNIGLDIGTTTVKAVVISIADNTTALQALAAAPTTTHGMMSESIVDLQALADTIRSMLDAAKISEQNVVISLPENQVATRIIEMPELSEQEVAAALKYEMEQYIPLPLDQARTDWQIISHFEKNGKKMMNVLIVGAPIKVLEKYEKVLSFAKLEIVGIETEILALHRTMFPLINTENPSVIVHIGAVASTIALTRGGALESIFITPVGGIAITRAISIDLGIDIAQAESFKKAYGLNQEALQGKIGKSLNPTIDAIVSDIKKAILQYKEKNQGTNVHQIILSGGTALLPGIDVYLTNALGVQVVVGNGWTTNAVANVPQEALIDAPSFNVAVGLALKQL